MSRVGTGAATVVVFGRETQDQEFAERIARHRADRPEHWTTLEADDASGWSARVPEGETVLVDCMGTLLGLIMEEAGLEAEPADPEVLPAAFEAHVESALGDIVGWLLSRRGDTVVVTNEVGEGVVPAYALGRVFRDVLGRANRALVDGADAAYLCVAGRLVDLCAIPTEATWPED
jgi:adenosyl cobinamide kinase/adenosyl cobinamide phosphate guanylyltransferase